MPAATALLFPPIFPFRKHQEIAPLYSNQLTEISKNIFLQEHFKKSPALMLKLIKKVLRAGEIVDKLVK